MSTITDVACVRGVPGNSYINPLKYSLAYVSAKVLQLKLKCPYESDARRNYYFLTFCNSDTSIS